MTKFFTTKARIRLGFFFLLCCCMQMNVTAQTLATAYHKDPVVFINLMLPSADSILLVDGTAAMYNNKFSAAVDQYDADKLNNFLENICLFRNGDNLAIEARPLPKQKDTLFINMWGLRQPVYDLQISIKGISSLLTSKAWLIDNYQHTQTPVNLFGKTIYSFMPTIDSSSYKNRFMIVFTNEKQGIVSAPNGDVKIFPNPVSGNKVSLQFNNMIKDNYSITLSNLSGEILLQRNIVHDGGNNTYYLALNSVLAKGINTITINGANTKKTLHLPVVLNN